MVIEPNVNHIITQEAIKVKKVAKWPCGRPRPPVRPTHTAQKAAGPT